MEPYLIGMPEFTKMFGGYTPNKITEFIQNEGLPVVRVTPKSRPKFIVKSVEEWFKRREIRLSEEPPMFDEKSTEMANEIMKSFKGKK